MVSRADIRGRFVYNVHISEGCAGLPEHNNCASECPELDLSYTQACHHSDEIKQMCCLCAGSPALCFHGRRLMGGAMRHHWLLLGACGWVLLILMFVSKFITFRAVDGKLLGLTLTY